MKVLTIGANGWRNLQVEPFRFDAGVYLLVGQNGQGKTNFLEMVYFLAALKSFRTNKRQDLITTGADDLQLRATIESEGLQKDVEILWKPQGRQLSVNGNRVTDLVEYFRKIKAVCFSPEDLNILHGYPQVRRKFLDRLVFQCQPTHLFLVQKYNRVLKQRNTLLKKMLMNQQTEKSAEELAAWTDQMISYGAQVTENRLAFLARLNKILPQQYSRVCGLDTETGILQGEIQFHWIKKDRTDLSETLGYEDLAQIYQDDYHRTAKEEGRRGMSLWGPHLDDFHLCYGSRDASRYASTGQKKTLLLALRLCELELVNETIDEPPLLLLDDLSAELDPERLRTLIAFLAEDLVHFQQPVQTFVTTVATNYELFEPLGNIEIYNVKDGILNAA